MDEETAHLLHFAEAWFTEFYLPSTSNARKRELEVQIKSGLGNPKQWKFWVDSISLTQNHFLVMHCLNLLNDFIGSFWSLASVDQKNYIKERLLFYITQLTQVLPPFVSTKILKLFVDIGRNDWNHFYPNFFSVIENIVKEPKLTLVGLRILKMVSEEFMDCKEDMRQSRKDELKKLLTGKLPVICDIIQSVLTPVVDGIKIGNNAEVPKVLLNNSEEAIQVFSHVLTWIPAKFCLPQQFLSCLYFLSSCDPDTLNLYSLATSSLTCIGDLSSKSCSTPEMESNLWSIYEFTFNRLETLTRKCTESAELSDSSAEYFQQFTELLRPLLVNHLQRFESHQHFPTMTFLERFFKFTFSIPTLDLFLTCVDIWNDFLDRILAVSSCRSSSTKAAVLQSYSAPILALVDHLLMRIQMQHNQTQLEELLEDENGEMGEREEFFHKCIGVMIKAGEILPKEVLAKFMLKYSELQQIFMQIESLVQKSNAGNAEALIIPVSAKNDLNKLHCCLRDLATIAKATSSHCGLLTGDLYSTHAEQVLAVLHIILQAIQFINTSMSCLKTLQAYPPIPSDFVYLHTSLYAALESAFPWLVQFYNIKDAEGNSDQLNKLIVSIVKPCLDPVVMGAQTSSVTASSKAFKSLTKLVRIGTMFEMEPVARIYKILTENPAVAFGRFSSDVQINLIAGLSNILTLPIGHLGQHNQNWDQRAQKHAVLIAAVSARYISMQSNDLRPENAQIIRETFKIFDGLLQNASEDPKKSKQIMLFSMNPLLLRTVQLLPVLKKSLPERSIILGFVLDIFSCLKSAFPPELSPPLSDLFEGLFEQFLDPDELLSALRSSDPVHVESLATCFDLLKLVVGDPAYKSYLPAVLGLCHMVCPALQNLMDIKIDFKTASLELLLSVLQNHWTYFFKSVRIVNNSNGDGIDVSVKDEKSEDKDFLMIMHCLGSALIQPEISITQLVLRGLSQLQTSKHIFEKPSFLASLRKDYLDTLLTMLINKDKQLLMDEIYFLLYQIAVVDTEYFYSSYLPGFLESLSKLKDDQRRSLYGEFEMENDQVAFTEQIRVLVCEIRCFVVYNSTVISG